MITYLISKYIIVFQNSDGIKDLQVIIAQGTEETVIWKYLSLLDEWTQARVPIPPGEDYKVMQSVIIASGDTDTILLLFK